MLLQRYFALPDKLADELGSDLEMGKWPPSTWKWMRAKFLKGPTDNKQPSTVSDRNSNNNNNNNNRCKCLQHQLTSKWNVCQCHIFIALWNSLCRYVTQCHWPASRPTVPGYMSTFCIWSWMPTGKWGYLASGADKKDKRRSAQRILWCRMRLWDSEWPRNWGLDWEGEGWWLCLMLADLFLTENYNLFQLCRLYLHE